MVNMHRITFVLVGGDHCVDCSREVSPLVPISEQIHILAGPLQDAVPGAGVPTCKSEASRPAGTKTYLSQAPMDRRVQIVHYAAVCRS